MPPKKPKPKGKARKRTVAEVELEFATKEAEHEATVAAMRHELLVLERAAAHNVSLTKALQAQLEIEQLRAELRTAHDTDERKRLDVEIRRLDAIRSAMSTSAARRFSNFVNTAWDVDDAHRETQRLLAVDEEATHDLAMSVADRAATVTARETLLDPATHYRADQLDSAPVVQLDPSPHPARSLLAACCHPSREAELTVGHFCSAAESLWGFATRCLAHSHAPLTPQHTAASLTDAVREAAEFTDRVSATPHPTVGSVLALVGVPAVDEGRRGARCPVTGTFFAVEELFAALAHSTSPNHFFLLDCPGPAGFAVAVTTDPAAAARVQCWEYRGVRPWPLMCSVLGAVLAEAPRLSSSALLSEATALMHSVCPVPDNVPVAAAACAPCSDTAIFGPLNPLDCGHPSLFLGASRPGCAVWHRDCVSAVGATLASTVSVSLSAAVLAIREAVVAERGSGALCARIAGARAMATTLPQIAASTHARVSAALPPQSGCSIDFLSPEEGRDATLTWTFTFEWYGAHSTPVEEVTNVLRSELCEPIECRTVGHGGITHCQLALTPSPTSGSEESLFFDVSCDAAFPHVAALWAFLGCALTPAYCGTAITKKTGRLHLAEKAAPTAVLPVDVHLPSHSPHAAAALHVHWLRWGEKAPLAIPCAVVAGTPEASPLHEALHHPSADVKVSTAVAVFEGLLARWLPDGSTVASAPRNCVSAPAFPRDLLAGSRCLLLCVVGSSASWASQVSLQRHVWSQANDTDVAEATVSLPSFALRQQALLDRKSADNWTVGRGAVSRRLWRWLCSDIADSEVGVLAWNPSTRSFSAVCDSVVSVGDVEAVCVAAFQKPCTV